MKNKPVKGNVTTPTTACDNYNQGFDWEGHDSDGSESELEPTATVVGKKTTGDRPDKPLKETVTVEFSVLSGMANVVNKPQQGGEVLVSIGRACETTRIKITFIHM